MSFFSFYFLIFLCVLVLAFYASAVPAYRKTILSVANLIFLFTFLPNLDSAIAFALFLILSYALLVMVGGEGWRYGPGLGILASLIFLVYAKRYEFLELVVHKNFVNHGFELIGISYMSFKLIHMFVDLKERQLEPVTFSSYANYQLGFFSVVAGPIQRYNDFFKFWNSIGRGFATQQEGLKAWGRVLTGMIKIGLFAQLTLYIYNAAKGDFFFVASSGETLLRFGLIFYAYPLYIYLNFSGYCDIVIGAAGLLGMKHQENFNHPYLARNLIDFWNRWHISLTYWIRDYVFMTSYKWVASRWPTWSTKIGYFLLFVALFLAGVWHGSTWNFFVFGLLHGVGIATAQMYGDALRFFLGKARLEVYNANRWIHFLAVGLTINYICFCFLFFRPEMNVTFKMLDMVFLSLKEIVHV